MGHGHRPGKGITCLNAEAAMRSLAAQLCWRPCDWTRHSILSSFKSSTQFRRRDFRYHRSDVRREGRSCQVTSRPFSLLPKNYLRQGSDAPRYFQLDWRSEIISRLVRHHTEVREEQEMTASSTCYRGKLLLTLDFKIIRSVTYCRKRCVDRWQMKRTQRFPSTGSYSDDQDATHEIVTRYQKNLP